MAGKASRGAPTSSTARTGHSPLATSGNINTLREWSVHASSLLSGILDIGHEKTVIFTVAGVGCVCVRLIVP